MVEPLVELKELLTSEEIEAIPLGRRSTFVESMLFRLIELNSNRGLTFTDIVNMTRYSKNAVSKALETLHAKRKISRLILRKSVIYFPIGQVVSDLTEIKTGVDGALSFKVIIKQNNKYVLVQERELDERGIMQDVGGVLLPLEIFKELNSIVLSQLTDEKVKKMVNHS